MIKITSSQLNFLQEAVREAASDKMIGYTHTGEIHSDDKEILDLIEFINNLNIGEVIEKKG